MELHLLILIGLFVLPAILAAFAADLLRAAIALLVCSVGLTLLLFNMGAQLAAVFELSVCAGLITVLFVNAISLTRLVSEAERAEKFKDYRKRFIWIWLVVLVVGVVLWVSRDQWATGLTVSKAVQSGTVGDVLWKERGLDLIGQIAMLLVGVFGVVVLFKRGKSNA